MTIVVVVMGVCVLAQRAKVLSLSVVVVVVGLPLWGIIVVVVISFYTTHTFFLCKHSDTPTT